MCSSLYLSIICRSVTVLQRWFSVVSTTPLNALSFWICLNPNSDFLVAWINEVTGKFLKYFTFEKVFLIQRVAFNNLACHYRLKMKLFPFCETSYMRQRLYLFFVLGRIHYKPTSLRPFLVLYFLECTSTFACPVFT